MVANKHTAKKMQLDFSVAQGSCAETVLYTTVSNDTISITAHATAHRGYADDHKNFTAGDEASEKQCISELESTLEKIICWMDHEKQQT